ncbi:hypothetical protein PYW07_016705 [Mythimna separata]|uniref:Uncharacterized protein n=1 Tax=Mythimna separata TaxID=271217 RepID=A0AAD8DSB6_MYTSE|nr:hypothetical protein PYW07_016705 [Mythimna separata]
MWSRKQSVCSAVSGVSRGDEVEQPGNGVQLYPFAIGLRVRVLQIVCGIGGLVLGAVGWLEERQKPALGLGVPAGAITVLAAAISIYYSRGFGGWVSARSRASRTWGAPWRALGPSPCAAVPLTMLWAAAIGAHVAMLAFCIRSLMNIGIRSQPDVMFQQRDIPTFAEIVKEDVIVHREDDVKNTSANTATRFRRTRSRDKTSGLHSNLPAVHHHLETDKPHLLFLTETQIRCPSDVAYLNYPGYSMEHHFLQRAGVCVYVRNDICCQRLRHLEDPSFSTLWLLVDTGTSDHCLVKSVTSFSLPDCDSRGERRMWRYKLADWDEMRHFFASYPWQQVCFSSKDPSSCEVVRQAMEYYIPYSDVPIGGSARPWFNADCAEAEKHKHSAFLTWVDARDRKAPDLSSKKRAFNHAAKSYKKALRKARFDRITHIGKKLSAQPAGSRAFWSLAKSVEANFCRPTLPPLVRPDGTLAHTAREKAGLFASLFARNSRLDTSSATPPTLPHCDTSMSEVRIRNKEVLRALCRLDVNKANGSDGIPAIVLKACAPELCGSTTCIGVASAQLTLSVATLGAAVFMFQLDLRFDASLSPPPRQSDTHICTAVSMVPLTSVAINSGNSDAADSGGSPLGKEKEPPPLDPPT